MRTTKKLTLLTLLVSLNSYATEIHEHHCVDSGIEKVHQLLTRYSEYSTMNGSKYSVSLAGTEVDLIQMIKSQAKPITSTEAMSENLVWLVLQPALIDNAKLYPRFLLDCKVNWSARNSFTQKCTLQKDKQHFGLSDLTINLLIQTQDPLCKAGSTGMKMDFRIDGNSDEIDQIKKATLGPAGILSPLISTFFDEDAFFRNYFSHLYDQWTKSL